MSTEFEPDRPYRLSPTVSLRPEPFGALVYDFTTRQLSFLKTPALARVVGELAQHPDAGSALTAADVPPAQQPQYLRALAGLLTAGTIQPR